MKNQTQTQPPKDSPRGVSEPPSRDLSMFENWGRYDESQLEARRRAGRNRNIALGVLGAIFICGFINVMLGIPQGYIAQSMVSLPQYPGAQRIEFRNGLDCPLALGVYCYTGTYRTPDSVQQVIAYYEGLRRPSYLPQVKFASETNARYFGEYQVARICADLLGHRSCDEIALFARDSGTEIKQSEIGYPGDQAPQSDEQ